MFLDKEALNRLKNEKLNDGKHGKHGNKGNKGTVLPPFSVFYGY